MFIPEPFSLTTGIMGVIGFLATVRNGIERLYQDKKKWERYGRDIVIIDAKTKWEKKTMDEWVDLWMAWGKEDRLLVEFWGENGLKEINDLAEDIAKLCQSIEEPMHRYLHSAKTPKLIKVPRKLKWVVAGGAYLQIQVKTLEEQVSDIKKKAIGHFMTPRGNRVPATIQSLHDIGNLRHLTSIAMATAQVSDDLKAACQNSKPSHIIDLELNLFNIAVEYCPEQGTQYAIGPSEGLDLRPGRHIRSKAISDSALEGRLNFVVLTKRKPQSNVANDQVLRARVRNIPPDAPPNAITLRGSLVDALQDIRNDSQLNSGWDVYGSHRFDVRAAFNDYSDGYDDWPSLKEVFWKSIQHPALIAESPIPKKVKLGFELAECGLIFLRTSWLANLCSCTIRERRPAQKCHYVIRGGEDGHFKPTEVNYQLCHCWSEGEVPQELKGVGLRRLGILLSEIALGTPVVKIRTLANSPHELSYVRMIGPPPGLSVTKPISELPNEVFNATNSAGYKSAVTFCLNDANSWGSFSGLPETVQTERIKQYYWGVLMPLFMDLEAFITEEIQQGG